MYVARVLAHDRAFAPGRVGERARARALSLSPSLWPREPSGVEEEQLVVDTDIIPPEEAARTAARDPRLVAVASRAHRLGQLLMCVCVCVSH